MHVWASLVVQQERICLPMPAKVEGMSSIPGLRRSLEKKMATHSSIPAWKIPWTEESGGLLFRIPKVRHNLATKPPPLLIYGAVLVIYQILMYM